jgi:hypothetical protein
MRFRPCPLSQHGFDQCTSAAFRSSSRCLTSVAIVSLFGSFGKYGGPLFWARHVASWTDWLGHAESPVEDWMRIDGYLRDGDGGFYWFLGAALPGFDTFRYPSKLITLTCLSLTGLAAAGWDDVIKGNARRARTCALVFFCISLVAIIAFDLVHQPFAHKLSIWARSDPSDGSTAFDVPGALTEIRSSLWHGAIALAGAFALLWTARRRPLLAGALAVVAVAADLSIASARFIITVPQAIFETTPRMQELIEKAERSTPSPGPFRILRMKNWVSRAAKSDASSLNEGHMLQWSRATLAPDFAIPLGYSYSFRRGTTEAFDTQLFFTPYTFEADHDTARQLKVNPGQPYVYYPRRAFDLWGARYFILPARIQIDDAERGIYAFLPRTEMLDPDRRLVSQPESEAWKRWADVDDVRLLRNLDAYPRAWIVHRGRLLKPLRGNSPSDRKVILDQMFFPNDVLWHSTDRRVNDPKQMAWVETDDFAGVSQFLSQAAADASEHVTVVAGTGPQLVELDAVLKSPGIVVLAESFYPGWTLTIDGNPADILRVNRIMRGAAVPAGKHQIVYRYQPGSFRWGRIVSLIGIVALGVFWLSTIQTRAAVRS